MLIEQDILDRQTVDSRREDRRVAMLDAAESLFLEQGYEQTTLAGIVRRSGGSLATLYEHFGNKQGLLRAMIARVAEVNRPPVPAKDPCRRRPSEELRGYAHTLYNHLVTPRMIALVRIVMTESLRDPKFARSVYEEIHLSALEELAQLFAQWTEQGIAQIDRPRAAADLFVAVVVSDTKLRALCADSVEPLSSEELDWRLEGFISHLKIL